MEYNLTGQARIKDDFVHVQVTDEDNKKYVDGARRSYGAAFDVTNDELFSALKDRKATLPSKAGTSQKYVPVALFADEDGLVFTLDAEARPSNRLFASIANALFGEGDGAEIEVSYDKVTV